MFRNSAVVFAIFAGFAALGADTVVFRDGREFTNVRTEIQGHNLTIYLPSGEVIQTSMREVKSVRPGPIAVPQKPDVPRVTEPAVVTPVTPVNPVTPANPTTPVTPSTPVTPVTDPADKKTETVEKIEKTEPAKPQNPVETAQNPAQPAAPSQPAFAQPSPFAQNPVLLGAQSLIPGWSGLYQSNHYVGGLIFSVLELYAVYRCYPWLGRPVPLSAARKAEIFLVSQDGTPQGGGRAFANGIFLDTLGLVQNPIHKNEYMRSVDYGFARRRTQTALGLILIADAAASIYFRKGETGLTLSSVDHGSGAGLAFFQRF